MDISQLGRLSKLNPLTNHHPLDNLNHNWTIVLKQIREYFYSCEWYEAYDSLEFVANNYKRYQFQESVNFVRGKAELQR